MYVTLFIIDIFLCILLCIIKGFSVNGNRKGSVFAWFRYRINIKILFTLLLAMQIPLVFFIGFCGANPDKQILHLTPELSDLRHIGQLWGNLRFGERLLQGMGCIFTVISGSGAEFLVHFTDFEWVGIALCVIAPFLTMSTLILSILDFFPLWFIPRREYLIFSQMDDRSLLLAKNMMKKTREDEGEENNSSWKLRRDRKVIFLHTDKSKLSAEERDKVNQVRGRIYPYSEVDLLRIHRGLRKRTLRFFFLSKDNDESFSRLKELIDGVQQFNLFQTRKRMSEKPAELEARGIYQQELYFLSESDSSPLLVDHLRSKMSDGKVRKPVFAHTEIHLLDRYRLVTYDLLREHPLYKHSTENKEINILIIGFGKVGQSFYKTANAFSYIKGHKVSFTILDNKINDHWKELLAQTPEIDEDIAPVIRSVNADATDLIRQITKLSKDKPFTYIMLSVGDDDRNIRIARTLVRYYRKAHWEKNAPCLPAIFVNLENAIKSQYVNDIFKLEDDPKDLTSLSPVAIGGDRTTFSEKLLLNRKIWEMAIKLHNKMNPKTTEDDESSNNTTNNTNCINTNQDQKPFMTEYERRSSIAAVSYAKYHIYANSLTQEDEHNRWIRYSRSEGMRNIGPETAKEIIEASHTHRDIVAGLTPCLVSNARLNGIYNDLDLKHRAVVKKPLDSFSEKDSLVVKVAPKLAEFYDDPSNPLDLYLSN